MSDNCETTFFEFLNTRNTCESSVKTIEIMIAANKFGNQFPRYRAEAEAFYFAWNHRPASQPDYEQEISEINDFLIEAKDWKNKGVSNNKIDRAMEKLARLKSAAPVKEEWQEAGLTPQEMWDEIQAIKLITDDDGTHGAPRNLVQQMSDELKSTASTESGNSVGHAEIKSILIEWRKRVARAWDLDDGNLYALALMLESKLSPAESVNAELVEALESYNKLLIAELHDVIPIASDHGWKSIRFEYGEKMRERIALAKSRANNRERMI